MIDLDRFKSVNDHYGHSVGDQVIQTIASRLSALLHKDETLVRMGGDEFLVLSTRRTEADSLSVLAERIVHKINLPIPIDGAEDRTVGASVGIAVLPNGPDLEYELLRSADEAMYQAKKTGRNRSCLHSSLTVSLPQGAEARV
ncbi:GGDEF domain-containing protein [Stappia sp. BW2]|nr:GGDEF domain-containing protein [Stappia sp. BW2]